MNDHVYRQKPGFGLSIWLMALFCVSLFLLAIASALDFLNFLGDFLHAPIGIKDYPPEPNVIVQLAKLAIIPLTLSAGLCGVLGFLSRVPKAIPLMLGLLIVISGGTGLVGGILREYKNRELFHGQLFFTTVVTSASYVLFLSSCVGLGAYHCMAKWQCERKPRYGVAGTLLLTSIPLGLIGILGIVMNSYSLISVSVWGIPTAVLGYICYNANYLLGRPR